MFFSFHRSRPRKCESGYEFIDSQGMCSGIASIKVQCQIEFKIVFLWFKI